MTPAQEAAALWGSAENRGYSVEARLSMALAALKFFGGLAERVEALAEEWSTRPTWTCRRHAAEWAHVAKLRATLDGEKT